MAGGDLGAVRTLVVAARLEDLGVTAGLAKINARAGLAEASMGRAAASVSELRNQLFFLAFTGGAATAALVSQQAKLESQITLASLALDGTTDSMQALEAQTFRLAERFNQLPSEVAASIREIQQLGVESAATREQLARAAIGLSVLTGEELAQDEAAKSIFRLLRLTTQTQAEMEAAAQSARGYASAIALAGDASAAGIAEVARAVEIFASLGAVAEFAREDIIALSAAFTDVEEGRLTRIASSIQRLFGRELVEQGQVPRLARFMGITADEFVRIRKNNPAELLALLARRLREGRAAGEELLPTLQQLGFTNVRDQRTLAQFSAGLDKFRGLLPKVRREVMLFNKGLISQTEFRNRLQAILGTTESQFEGLLGSMQKTATIMGDVLVKGVLPLAGGLRGLARVLNENPLLAGLLVTGLGTFTVGALIRGTRLLAGFGAAGLPSGLFGPAAQIGKATFGAARTATRPLLNALGLGVGSAAGRAAPGLAGLANQRAIAASAARIAQQQAGRGAFAQTGGAVAGFLGRRGLSAGAARAVGVLSVVGGLVAILPILGKVAGGVADSIESLIGEGTGTFSALGELLVLILNIVELAGSLVQRVFDEIVELVQNPIGAALIGAALGGVVGGGPIGALIGGLGLGGTALFGEDLVSALGGLNSTLDETTKAISGEEGPEGDGEGDGEQPPPPPPGPAQGGLDAGSRIISNAERIMTAQRSTQESLSTTARGLVEAQRQTGEQDQGIGVAQRFSEVQRQLEEMESPELRVELPRTTSPVDAQVARKLRRMPDEVTEEARLAASRGATEGSRRDRPETTERTEVNQDLTVINQDKDQAKFTAQDILSRGTRNVIPIKNIRRA